MGSPFDRLIKGKFVIVGKEPDGDSIRFIADDPKLYQSLHRADRIKPSRDGSVQLRFEGVDAPELHYGDKLQPMGGETRDRLLDLMGFKQVTFASSTSSRVTSANPDTIPGAILSQAAETNGRPVSYILLAEQANQFEDGQWVQVDLELLEQTINFQLLAQGMAYYTVYSSMPLEIRQQLREVAATARQDELGVWVKDMTPEFILEDQDSIGPKGQLILPKLFRRSTDYLKAVAKGFRGNLEDWLIANPKENDKVLVCKMELRLSEILDQRNRRIVFQPDLLDVVFVEK